MRSKLVKVAIINVVAIIVACCMLKSVVSWSACHVGHAVWPPNGIEFELGRIASVVAGYFLNLNEQIFPAL